VVVTLAVGLVVRVGVGILVAVGLATTISVGVVVVFAVKAPVYWTKGQPRIEKGELVGEMTSCAPDFVSSMPPAVKCWVWNPSVDQTWRLALVAL
jgi:hypothetical protein